MRESVNDVTASSSPPPVLETELTNEAKAFADILSWSKECCPWQRDALRRLCLGTITDNDVEELILLCKGESVKTVPLAAEHVRDAKSSRAIVNLSGIHSVENVNALAPGERLTFFKSGLTVVYGDNGSGKTGYIRILKKVCRARSPKDDKIVPNIYASKTGPQKAVMDFTANGENRNNAWINGQPGNPLLSSISVFDCQTANVHVDQTNDVAYTPFPMKVLEELAQLCLRIKQRLITEIETIRQQTPASLV